MMHTRVASMNWRFFLKGVCVHLPSQIWVNGVWILAMVVTGAIMAWNWRTPSMPAASWIGLTLLFWQAMTASSAKSAFVRSTVIGMIALLFAFYWVPQAIRDTFDLAMTCSWLLFLFFLSVEAVSVGLLGLVVRYACRQRGLGVVWAAACAVAIEALWPRVFPWRFAYTQYDFLQFIQIAEFFGSEGITFLMVTCTVIFAILLTMIVSQKVSQQYHSTLWLLAVPFVLPLTVYLWGERRLSHWQRVMEKVSEVQIGLVQIDPSYNDSLEKMRLMTQQFEQKVDLVCWPETSLDSYHFSLGDFTDEKHTRELMLPPRGNARPTAGLKCTILAGGNSHSSGGTEEEGPFWPTAFLIDSQERILQRYFKRVLMPMGEFIPLQDVFPMFREWMGLDEISKPGSDPSPLHLPDGTRVGVLMCYEDMIPRAVRESTNAGAEILVSLINGSAFANKLALEQHLQLARLRAIENRRSLVRCSATGVTCLVLPTGEIAARLPVQEEGYLLVGAPKIAHKTFYVKVGHWFSCVCVVFSMSIPLVVVIKRLFGARVHRLG